MLELRDVYKTFNKGTINEKHALNGVSLTLREGEASLRHPAIDYEDRALQA